MDVEATLAELRALTIKVNDEWDAACAGPVEPNPDHDAYRFAELFDALDRAIVGGRSPRDWRQGA